MFDFIRDLRKSDEEKRQEAITAYLDGHLTPSERQRFEEKLEADPGLRHEVEQQSFIKRNLQQLPQVRAPRNFTLDPAQYGAPEPDTAIRLYPVLRTATVLVGIFFVIAVGAALLIPQGSPMESVALAPMAGEVAEDVRGAIPEAEQEQMEEMASPIIETELFAEEEAAVEAPVEGAPAPAEEPIAGTPSADTAMEADQAVEEAMEEEAVAQEAVPEGELEEAEPGISAAAPATAEDQQMTEEAARAGGIGTKPAMETPPVEAPAEEALEAEALPAEPLPTASLPPPAETPSSTPPQLAEVAPTSPTVGQELTEEAAPADEQQEVEQQDFGRTAFTLLTFLAVILGIAVIVLSGATLLVRRKI